VSAVASIKHATKGLARPCSAWDIFSIRGGLQCGNCLAHNVPAPTNRCAMTCADGKPCPLQREHGDLCWVHFALAHGGGEVKP
jgi:hypothetical protein